MSASYPLAAHRVSTLILITAMTLLLGACEQAKPPAPIPVTRLLGDTGDNAGYERVTDARPFRFPADHGPHPRYRNEWWYFTGNLHARDGEHFGYQLTFFRFALSPQPLPVKASAWRSNQLYLAHFAITDVEGARFHAFEHRSRAALAIAGSQAEPFAIWVDDWSARSEAGRFAPHLHARDGAFGVDLSLTAAKPVVLQGDRGLSQKGAQPGNASYYYSLTRLPTSGTITIDGRVLNVEGASWMDREWSTSALEPNQIGWDWFSLQLDDGRELMFYRMRHQDKAESDPHSAGILVAQDGSSTRLDHDAVQIEELSRWRSSHSDVSYPSHWRLRVESADLDLEIEPRLADQELQLSVRYWEGAVRVRGRNGNKKISGEGYVELVGYGARR